MRGNKHMLIAPISRQSGKTQKFAGATAINPGDNPKMGSAEITVKRTFTRTGYDS